MYSRLRKITNNTSPLIMLLPGQKWLQFMVHQENLTQEVGQDHMTYTGRSRSEVADGIECL